MMSERLGENPVDSVRCVMNAEQLMRCIEDAGRVDFADSLCRYVAQLAAATRSHPSVELGVSPRASLAVMQASRALAYINGRSYVIPEDIVRLLIPVWSHRIVLRRETRMTKRTIGSILEDVVTSVAPPIRRS